MEKRRAGRYKELEYYKKKNVIKVRLDTEEYETLRSLAIESGKSMSELLRRGLKMVKNSWEW